MILQTCSSTPDTIASIMNAGYCRGFMCDVEIKSINARTVKCEL